MKPATEILNDEYTLDSTVVNEAEQHYIDNSGMMETDSDSDYDERILELLANSFTSPVQSVETSTGSTYYGAIDYVEEDEWYGFEAHDERSHGRRVVGIQEIDECSCQSDLPHVTAGDPTGSFADQPDASYEDLASGLKSYYDQKHGEDRSMPEQAGPPDHAKMKQQRNNGNSSNNGNNGNNA